MIITFPLISFGLCAWMTVFGFYLKLEESAWVKIRRKKKKEKLEKILTSDWMKSHSKDDLTEVTLFLDWKNANYCNLFHFFRACMTSVVEVCSRTVENCPNTKTLRKF